MIDRQPFGRTGHLSTRTIFGAVALRGATQAEADRTLELLLEYGVNHIDTAPMYGVSELRIGPWMERYRYHFFLATKTDQRLYQKARDQIHLSLERLRVDHADLLQLHNLTDIVDWENTMGPEGALKALVEAREQGLTSLLGVTGHGMVAPKMLKRSLERFDFDTILLPYNYLMMQNPEYSDDFESLLALCQEHNVAVQTMKAIGRGLWGDKPRTHVTWYEPLQDQTAIDKMVHWTLSRPGIFLNTAGDLQVLPKVLDAASRFQSAPSDEEMREVVFEQEMVPLFG